MSEMPAASHHSEVVILGPPGSGKGTHARILAQRLSVPHVSTGELFRREINAGSPLGRQITDTVRNGSLVDDTMVLELVERALRSDEASRGWILDGAPRTVEQAELLAPLIERPSPAMVIALDVDEAELRRRLTQRRSEEQRADDAPQVVEDRLAVWAETGPQLFDRYELGGLLIRVDANGSVSDVAARLGTAFDCDVAS